MGGQSGHFREGQSRNYPMDVTNVTKGCRIDAGDTIELTKLADS